jgi:anti-anti-sigma factor
MLTGEEKYLEVAEKGAAYLREQFRCVDSSEDIVYWYHGVDYQGGGRYKKIFASEFGDDYDAIPAYEQIYALAGLTQMYRVTGNPDVLKDIEMTINLFDKYFLDKENEGYWSHIDPILFSGTSESLGRDRSRKNWNSCGDHTPAYLINLYLATGEERYKDMLKYTADIIVDHFPDYENSPFVQEKYHGDWNVDTTWGWQQNHAVVGHNLKIAWNLMRVQSVIKDEKYVEMAEKIAELMPKYGMDLQRGGWYDVVDRVRGKDEAFNHYAWHDRKAWWQQEQGILAYYILAGILQKDDYLKTARESAAFYNAWFPDHDSGGVYFNVLANGIPYLLGTERLKASHSMSGYHSFELAYLCSVYINLLITKKHLDLYFKPAPHALKDNILRVQPDILPKGSVIIDKVWIEGKVYDKFDANDMTIILPDTTDRIKVKVRLIPTTDQDEFDLSIDQEGETTTIIMTGKLDNSGIDQFSNALRDVIQSNPKSILFDMNKLKTMNSPAIRALIFERQKTGADMIFRGVNEEIRKMLQSEEFSEGVSFTE